MTLISLRYDECPDMSCRTLINPATEQMYAVLWVEGLGGYAVAKVPMTPDGPQRLTSAATLASVLLAPPGKPGHVQLYDTEAEALQALEVHDALGA